MDNQRKQRLGTFAISSDPICLENIETMGTKPRYAAFLRVLRRNFVTRPLLSSPWGFAVGSISI